MDAIRQYFQKFVPLTNEEWSAFQQCLVKKEISRKELLLQEGQRCDFLAFVESGLFRFYNEKNGEERITAFFFPGDFVSNYRSFLTGNVSEHHIESMKDAVVHIIHKNDLLRLYDSYQNLERIGRLIAENLYLGVASRLDSFLYATPEQRYKDLQNRNSRLLQDIPQYMLASYLGVQPETLSRIRARK